MTTACLRWLPSAAARTELHVPACSTVRSWINARGAALTESSRRRRCCCAVHDIGRSSHCSRSRGGSGWRGAGLADHGALHGNHCCSCHPHSRGEPSLQPNLSVLSKTFPALQSPTPLCLPFAQRYALRSAPVEVLGTSHVSRVLSLGRLRYSILASTNDEDCLVYRFSICLQHPSLIGGQSQRPGRSLTKPRRQGEAVSTLLLWRAEPGFRGMHCGDSLALVQGLARPLAHSKWMRWPAVTLQALK